MVLVEKQRVFLCVTDECFALFAFLESMNFPTYLNRFFLQTNTSRVVRLETFFHRQTNEYGLQLHVTWACCFPALVDVCSGWGGVAQPGEGEGVAHGHSRWDFQRQQSSARWFRGAADT